MAEHEALAPWANLLPQDALSNDLPSFSPQELWQVMVRQVAFYTGMESTSIPAETAAELLESVLFCVRVAHQTAPNAAHHTLDQWLLAGQRQVYLRRQAGLRLQAAAQKALLPLDNAVYQDALAETRRFFTLYDVRLLAQQIPCMIDYPLAVPPEDALQGVDYILAYLRRRLHEDLFCGCFAPAEVKDVLCRHTASWRHLPLNLFAPVLAHAVGKALLGVAVTLEAFTPGQRQALRHRLGDVGPAALSLLLSKVATNMCNALHIWNTDRRKYYLACALDLAPRILAADASGLAHVFP